MFYSINRNINYYLLALCTKSEIISIFASGKNKDILKLASWKPMKEKLGKIKAE